MGKPTIRFEGYTDDWEQRKLGEVCEIKDSARIPNSEWSETGVPYIRASDVTNENTDGVLFISQERYEFYKNRTGVPTKDDVLFNGGGEIGKSLLITDKKPIYVQGGAVLYARTSKSRELVGQYLKTYFETTNAKSYVDTASAGGTMRHFTLKPSQMMRILMPSVEEQEKIGEYFANLDHLITLHQHKQNNLKNILKYIEITLIITKEAAKMPELEKIIEEKLIDQLIYGDSQWTYRKDLKTEEDLWKNFKYILEQNNKDRLNGESLSESEFEQVKNQLQFSSFYKAGEWLVGENGKVQVHVQRDTERLHLVVMNHEHIAGGSSVYEVINQYSALKNEEDDTLPARDRRFDVTLMINGLPMIHIELKNRQHSYMDGFHQIKNILEKVSYGNIFCSTDVCS